MKFKKGDTVIHDFSKIEGEVVRTRNSPDGYNYLVRWLNYVDPTWYLESVLLPYEQAIQHVSKEESSVL